MSRRLALLAALLLSGAGCRARSSTTTDRAAPALERQNQRIFTGMCDASAVVPLSSSQAIVADDEENVLRVYDVERGGAPLSSFELSGILGLPTKRRRDGSSVSRELDIEAGARIGDDAYFLTSHGRDSRGRRQTERLKFFALHLTGQVSWQLRGSYDRLLDDLLADARLAPYGLSRAAELPAKAAGGLNLEGMATRRGGGLWLGFRNPLPQGRALLVPLLNPEAVLTGARAELGSPLLLDLGGRGVRALSYWRGSYVIAAGAFDGTSSSALYRWDGQAAVEALPVAGLEPYNTEALFTTDERSQLLLLSDDGSKIVDGVECKKLSDPSRKRFRGLLLTPGAAWR